MVVQKLSPLRITRLTDTIELVEQHIHTTNTYIDQTEHQQLQVVVVDDDKVVHHEGYHVELVLLSLK